MQKEYTELLLHNVIRTKHQTVLRGGKDTCDMSGLSWVMMIQIWEENPIAFDKAVCLLSSTVSYELGGDFLQPVLLLY